MRNRPGWGKSGEEQLRQLQQVGDTFMIGLRVGLEAVAPAEIPARLGSVDREFRGFAYEGCGMGLAVADSLSARPRRVREYVDGPAADHVFMAYIGVGWALARIPRMRWRAVTPADPIRKWMLLDGLGFHEAFFKTERYVNQAWRPDRYPGWNDDQAYAHRAVDQGIGRALWFVNGANPEKVAERIGRFEESRHSDLWAGAGLASVYAGGVDSGALATMRELAGRYRPNVSQGAVFAAKTRHMTGLVMPHTEIAIKSHCEMTVQEAAELMDETGLDLPPDGAVPAFEIWRQRIESRFR